MTATLDTPIAPPADETGTYTLWVTRGFDPWTREGGAGNTWRAVEINPANGRIFFVDQIVQSGSSDSVQ